ncbi:hypothetical protein ARALYDRAFT_900343 [Arabidopsis lyrata subsp. lyrata]|uniref:Uncharacterized protein n=1 Tax=Arabidopsis lyrata subsp. lyrata TaxID=81972 RepID=D7L1Y8_ARALL|nr:hypothetical protein ARALYDRAFT_900343 [Arabidopsis lyrata subsp. lyrata]
MVFRSTILTNSFVFSVDSSYLQPTNVPVLVVFSDQRCRRSMENSNVYISESSFGSIIFRFLICFFSLERLDNDGFADLSDCISLAFDLNIWTKNLMFCVRHWFSKSLIS